MPFVRRAAAVPLHPDRCSLAFSEHECRLTTLGVNSIFLPSMNGILVKPLAQFNHLLWS